MNLAQIIDHTLLKPDVYKIEIERLCLEAIKYSFATVCVHPFFVPFAHKLLKDSQIKICTVVGFPLGMQTTEMKVAETREAIRHHVDEIDMVIHIGALKAKETEIVRNEIIAVVKAAQGNTVKVILETCLLLDAEIVLGCQLAKEAGAHFVKTSTGFSTGGATIDDVKLMRHTVGNEMGVKASGGIRDYKIAMAMVEAGATRIGTSNGISIVEHNNL